MKAKQIREALPLVEAMVALPRVKRRLFDKPKPPIDVHMLELAAAEMQGGEGQGSEAFVYLPTDIGVQVCDFALKLLRERAKKIGVEL